MKVRYLEIVSHDVDSVCKTYENSHEVEFGEPDELLGGARTCTLDDGSLVGVRMPMRDDENPIVRPYWLVDDIDAFLNAFEEQEVEIAMHSTEIPGKGKFAIYIQGGIEHGLWQL